MSSPFGESSDLLFVVRREANPPRGNFRLIEVKEAAAFLGLAEEYVRRLQRGKQLRAMSKKPLRFRLSELERFKRSRDTSSLIALSEAAKTIGVAAGTLNRWLLAGRATGQKLPNRRVKGGCSTWYLTPDEVARLKQYKHRPLKRSISAGKALSFIGLQLSSPVGGSSDKGKGRRGILPRASETSIKPQPSPRPAKRPLYQYPRHESLDTLPGGRWTAKKVKAAWVKGVFAEARYIGCMRSCLNNPQLLNRVAEAFHLALQQLDPARCFVITPPGSHTEFVFITPIKAEHDTTFQRQTLVQEMK